MKIKYLQITVYVVFVFLTEASCTKEFLDQKPVSSINETDYYKNVNDLETGLVACYAALNYEFYDTFEINDFSLGDIGSDDADCGSLHTDQPDGYNISYSRQDASNSWAFYAWRVYYAIISRCNLVIDKSPFTTGDTQKIRNIVNQAKFLRAMSYYHLTTDFGDVPLPVRFLNPDSLNLKRSPSARVWDQIVSDLKEATRLPDQNSAESGRATSGAAWGLLGKTFLTLKRYEEADRAFSHVVNSNIYFLVPDFGFIFRHEGENCHESIFEIQHMSKIASGGNIGSATAQIRLPRDPGAGGAGFDCPTTDLLNEFEPGDPRIIYTFMFPGDKFPIDGTNIYTVENFASPTGFNSRKSWIPWSERIGLNSMDWDINYRYMRYAEVLLLYAESLNENNKPDSALILVNQVRARARNTPSTDPQRISCAFNLPHPDNLLPDITTTDQNQLREKIWHEQRVELAIEGHRRNMLLRTGQFKDRMETAKAYANVTIEPYQWLLPIPLGEIEVSNNVLTQNPGY